jgi:hypothetical protein
MSKKATKNRAKKYEEKVKVKGSFNDLMNALYPKVKKNNEPLPKLSGNQSPKPKSPKKK